MNIRYFLVSEIFYEGEGEKAPEWREWKPYDFILFEELEEAKKAVRKIYKEEGYEFQIRSGIIDEEGIFNPNGPNVKVEDIDKESDNES